MRQKRFYYAFNNTTQMWAVINGNTHDKVYEDKDRNKVIQMRIMLNKMYLSQEDQDEWERLRFSQGKC